MKSRNCRITIETALQEAESRGKEYLRSLPPETAGYGDMQELVRQLEEVRKRGEEYAPLAREAFAEVSHRFNNPPLGSFTAYYMPESVTPLLRLVGIQEHDYAQTACISMLNRDVHLNTAFAEELADAIRAPPEEIMRGLLEHELGHYFLHPEHLGLALYLSFQEKKMFGGKTNDICPLFTDFIDNISAVDYGFAPHLLTTLSAQGAYELKKTAERQQAVCKVIEKAQEAAKREERYSELKDDKGVLGRTHSLHPKFAVTKPEKVLESLLPSMITRYAQPDPVNVMRFLATKRFLPQLKLPFSRNKEGRVADQSGNLLYQNDPAIEKAVCDGIDKLDPKNFSVRTSPRSYGAQLGLLMIFHEACLPLFQELQKPGYHQEDAKLP